MQILDTLRSEDIRLINSAVNHLKQNFKEPLQTVAAAAQTAEGEILTAINLYHFTGGPDAEAVLLANNLYKNSTITKIVSVHFDDHGTAEIINPCGKCRQMFNDYVPEIEVIVDDDGKGRLLNIAQVLPYSYRNKAAEYSRVIPEDSKEENI